MSDENVDVTEGSDDIEKMRAALEKYKKENQKFRTQRDEYKKSVDEGVANDETLSKFRQRTVQAEAKLKLRELGIKDADRLVKYLDLNKVTINDEDELEGLDDQIDSLKGDFPELFDPKRRVGGLADAGTGAGAVPGTKENTASAIQAKAMLRK